MDEGRRVQLAILAAMTPERRFAITASLVDFALAAREERLRRTFPGAREHELRWARVREALGLPSALTPP